MGGGKKKTTRTVAQSAPFILRNSLQNKVLDLATLGLRVEENRVAIRYPISSVNTVLNSRPRCSISVAVLKAHKQRAAKTRADVSAL